MKALPVYCINRCRGCQEQPLFGKLKVSNFLLSKDFVCRSGKVLNSSSLRQSLQIGILSRRPVNAINIEHCDQFLHSFNKTKITAAMLVVSYNYTTWKLRQWQVSIRRPMYFRWALNDACKIVLNKLFLQHHNGWKYRTVRTYNVSFVYH